MLEVLSNDMDIEYISQESQNIEPYNVREDEVNESIEEELSEKDYYKPLTEVSLRQKYRRTGPIISFLKDAALKNKVTINELLGIVIQEINYHQDKEICEIGKQLAECQLKSQKMTYDQATNLQQGLKLGRSSYQQLKYSLLQDIKILLT